MFNEWIYSLYIKYCIWNENKISEKDIHVLQWHEELLKIYSKRNYKKCNSEKLLKRVGRKETCCHDQEKYKQTVIGAAALGETSDYLLLAFIFLSVTISKSHHQTVFFFLF